MGKGSPRDAALEILRRVEREGAYSSLLLQRLDEILPGRDVSLVTELVYGTIRRARYLDDVIAAYSSRPVASIEPDLRLVLRLAIYQMLFLDRIPDHASVGEAVAQARCVASGRRAGAAAFVNGLLRAIARDRSRAPRREVDPAAPDPAAELARAESFPVWPARRWTERLGVGQGADLMAALNRPSTTALRVAARAPGRESVRAALEAEGIQARPSNLLDDFLVVTAGSVQRSDAFRRGLFYIQDEASGLVARLAGARRGQRILDACAAPGGKALAMAEAVGAEGLVVAADLHPARLRLLRANLDRMRVGSCAPVAADLAGQAAPLHPGVLFDTVLVDAPCSGTGVIRRNPELRERVGPESLGRVCKLQEALLERLVPLVRPGGALVYSVCSLEPEEGEEQILRFVGQNPLLHVEDPREFLPEPSLGLVRDTRAGPCLVTLPHRDDLDGFFAARLVVQR